MADHRLITIRISHYNEKARWALDRAGIAYREEPYMPMMHIPAVALATRGVGKSDPSSTRFSTPVLLTSSGELIADSEEIVRFADRANSVDSKLFSTPEVEELATRFHRKLFPHSRLVAYYYCLGQSGLMELLARENTPGWQRWGVRFGVPVLSGVLIRMMRINETSAQRSVEKAQRQIDEVDNLLADGRRYLVGDRFSAADLNLATGLAPLLLPTPEEGYAARLPRLDEVPGAFAELSRFLRQRPTGKFALRMFSQERGQRVLPL